MPNPGTGTAHSISTITTYPAGSGGNVKPERTLGGKLTKLVYPPQIALDSNSNLYAVSGNKSWVTVYAPGAIGDVAPIRTIAGRKTQLDDPSGIALDASGRVYVANVRGEVTVYAAGANGNVKPVNEIYTRLDTPKGITIR